MLLVWGIALVTTGLLVFGVWSFSFFIQKKYKLTSVESWVFTFVGFPLIVQILGLVSTPAACVTALIFCGLGIFHTRDLKNSVSNIFKNEKYALIIPIFYLVLKSIDAASPLPHGDPLTYHLRGPAIWIEQGRIIFPSSIPVAALCNLVEMYYLVSMQWSHWLSSFLNAQAAAHISAQWLSIWIGFVSSIVLLRNLFLVFRPNSLSFADSFSVLIAWFAAIAPQTEWLVPLAKNNWLATSFILASLFSFSSKAKIIRPELSGFSLAASYWAKGTNLLVIFPIIIAYFFKNRQRFNELFRFSLGAGIISLPFLIRNGFWTSNPFYPSEFGPLKSNLVSESDKLDVKGFFDPFHFPPPARFWNAVIHMFIPVLDSKKPLAFSGTITYLAGLFGVVVGCLQSKKIWLTFGVALCFFWPGAVIGPRFFEAHLLGYLIVLRLVGVCLLIYVIKGQKKKLAVALSFVSLLSVNLPVHVIWKDFIPTSKKSVEDVVYSLPMGAIYQCMNNLHDPIIVSDWLNTTYYVKTDIPTIGNHAPLEREMRRFTSFDSRLQRLKQMGFTHAWLAFPCGKDSDWPKCSALGVYSEKIISSRSVCRQGNTFVIAL
ncbi:MAG: hypothetical protein AB7F43_11435 [Bacteriovoracia bacterium]